MSATNKATSSASGKSVKANKKATAKKQSPQQAAVRARWDARGKTDEEVRKYFLECDHGDGLELLQTMRRHVEIAARAYDENIQRDRKEECANPNCKRPLGNGFPPYHKLTKKDPVTQMPYNIMTCSHPCYLIVHGKDGPAAITRR